MPFTLELMTLQKMELTQKETCRIQLTTYIFTSRKGMIIASLNVNSLLSHHDEIALLVKEQGTHCLALNETKIDKNQFRRLSTLDTWGLKLTNF